ncbi:hypothetical protein CDD82_7246 [Ophiocordyceps australis]|uniref:Zn(2)-C6 fungal-type domain-containing protein n=1 Tax=Ophiocordyceps australis TaxID=1399860 RepID=A0A2C5YR91_9HYPO|nr:hypothetical protein CDD82_7246 [Ophiocordyceps australis]
MAQTAYSTTYVVPSQDSLALSRESKEKDEPCDEDDSKAVMRRSFSTPNTARAAQESHPQPQTSTTGEKKRNKLGYHRTSIACSHCRRRKIRCIASPDVPNRCVNCIRLKKECSFYPVDQQPGVESRSRASIRQAAGPSVSSATSSPAIAVGSPSQPSKLPVTSSEYYSPDIKVTNGIHGSPYGYANQTSAGWMPGETTPKADALAMPWQSYAGDSPMSAHFSPYAPSVSASAAWSSTKAEPGSHDEVAWPDFQTPMRSMSLGDEGSSAQQQLHYMSMAQSQAYERRPSAIADVYSQPFAAPVASMAPDAATGLDSQGPLVADTAGEPWHHPLLPSEQQHPYDKQAVLFDSWPYDKTSEDQQEWMEEQRSQSAANQAPSEAYYSS